MVAEQRTYSRPWLAAYQLDALFHDARYGVCEASTKAGKTVACLVWLLEQAILRGGPGKNFLWAAPIFPQAKVAYRRMKMGMPEQNYKANETELTITLWNGATIFFRGADAPDSLYGDDYHAAVADEASRMKEEAWVAIRSTLTATRGPVRIIGNVKGRQNWAYRLARRAQAGEQNWHYAKITAYDAVQAGILDEEEIRDAQATLSEDVFRELYMAEPTEEGANPFGLAAIRACIAPLSTQQPAVWGWDLAKSVDWTVGIALDRDHQACKFIRFQQPWTATEIRIKSETQRVPALVDSTGVGDPIVERLQEQGGSNYEGFKFTSHTKQQLMEGLALAIQRQEVRFPDGPIRHELEAFEYVYARNGVKYESAEGMHDDCVMALALAVEKLSAPVMNFKTRYSTLNVSPARVARTTI